MEAGNTLNQEGMKDTGLGPGPMNIVRFRRYGGPEVLELGTASIPEPGPGEMLVHVRATTVTATETMFRRGRPLMTRLFMGLFRPKIQTLGEELAGEVAALGADVTEFQVGDRVFGTAGPDFGANAEYVTVAASEVLSLLPKNMSFAEAACTVDGVLTALPFLRDTGELQPGQKVLVYGASGSVGSAAVQIAVLLGAEVTAICSARNLDLVRSLGANYAFDYASGDFRRKLAKYDVIFDTVGKTRFADMRPFLAERGLYLQAAVGLRVLPSVLWTSLFGKKKAKIAATGLRPPAERRKDLELLREWLQSGKIKPLIDRTYPLASITEAHAYVEQGHKRGNVVVTL